MTAVPSCAGQCGLVQVLLGELARARGVSVDVMRVGHGLDPVPDKAGTLCALTQPVRLVPEEVGGYEQPIERGGPR